MTQLYTFNVETLFAQAYGADTYGAEAYSTASPSENTGSTTAPNTGFLGLTPDAAVSTAAGGLLVALAVVGTIFVISGRIKARRNNKG